MYFTYTFVLPLIEEQPTRKDSYKRMHPTYTHYRTLDELKGIENIRQCYWFSWFTFQSFDFTQGIRNTFPRCFSGAIVYFWTSFMNLVIFGVRNLHQIGAILTATNEHGYSLFHMHMCVWVIILLVEVLDGTLEMVYLTYFQNNSTYFFRDETRGRSSYRRLLILTADPAGRRRYNNAMHFGNATDLPYIQTLPAIISNTWDSWMKHIIFWCIAWVVHLSNMYFVFDYVRFGIWEFAHLMFCTLATYHIVYHVLYWPGRFHLTFVTRLRTTMVTHHAARYLTPAQIRFIQCSQGTMVLYTGLLSSAVVVTLLKYGYWFICQFILPNIASIKIWFNFR